jgi:predicted phage tail protein
MAESLVTVQLGGYLGKAYGKEHKFMVSNTKELIKAMCFQIKGFKKSLEEAESKGIGFILFNGRHNIGVGDEISFPCKKVFKILPAYIGSKRGGVFQIILGVVLLVAAFFGAPTGPAGFALLIGGAVQLLSPQPQGLKVKEDAANQSSYGFGGPVNTTAQGNPIGVPYGLREMGGAIISASIVAEDQT